RPCAASTSSKAAATCSGSETSQRTPNRPSGAPDPRWVTATLSPAVWNALAIANPIPRLPPVTSTDRPATVALLFDHRTNDLLQRDTSPSSTAGAHGFHTEFRRPCRDSSTERREGRLR